jgi:hypothetical protein
MSNFTIKEKVEFVIQCFTKFTMSLISWNILDFSLLYKKSFEESLFKEIFLLMNNDNIIHYLLVNTLYIYTLFVDIVSNTSPIHC